MREVLDETYRRQRDLVPHSFEDTQRFKELHRQQLLAKKQQAITEKEFFDFQMNKKGFWAREIHPLFAKKMPKDAVDENDDMDSDNDSDAGNSLHSKHTKDTRRHHKHRRHPSKSKTVRRRNSIQEQEEGEEGPGQTGGGRGQEAPLDR
jgi:hypothetical protein